MAVRAYVDHVRGRRHLDDCVPHGHRDDGGVPDDVQVVNGGVAPGGWFNVASGQLRASGIFVYQLMCWRCRSLATWELFRLICLPGYGVPMYRRVNRRRATGQPEGRLEGQLVSARQLPVSSCGGCLPSEVGYVIRKRGGTC